MLPSRLSSEQRTTVSSIQWAARLWSATEQKHISLITIQYFRVIWLNCISLAAQINIAAVIPLKAKTKLENNNDNIENVKIARGETAINDVEKKRGSALMDIELVLPEASS